MDRFRAGSKKPPEGANAPHGRRPHGGWEKLQSTSPETRKYKAGKNLCEIVDYVVLCLCLACSARSKAMQKSTIVSVRLVFAVLGPRGGGELLK